MQTPEQNTKSADPWYNVTPSYTPIYPIPPADQDYNRRYQLATKKVQKKLNFYKSLTTYLIVCAFLWAIALLTGSGYPWPIWVMLGWGVGLAFQAIDAFSFTANEQQRQQMIEEEVRRMTGQRY